MPRKSILKTSRRKLFTMAPAASTVSGSGRSLPFTMQRQGQTFWCWAATAVSVASFFRKASAWTQCSIVQTELGTAEHDCCKKGHSKICNRAHNLEPALTRVGHFDGLEVAPTSFDQVKKAIDKSRPLGVRIQWWDKKGREDGGHFVVIAGYSKSSAMYVDVHDPLTGSVRSDTYDYVSRRYEGMGTWSHTYWTKKA